MAVWLLQSNRLDEQRFEFKPTSGASSNQSSTHGKVHYPVPPPHLTPLSSPSSHSPVLPLISLPCLLPHLTRWYSANQVALAIFA